MMCLSRMFQLVTSLDLYSGQPYDGLFGFSPPPFWSDGGPACLVFSEMSAWGGDNTFQALIYTYIYIYISHTQQRSSRSRQVVLRGAHTNQVVLLEKMLRCFVGMRYTKCVCIVVNTGAQQWKWAIQREYWSSKLALCVVDVLEQSRHYTTTLVGKEYLELRDACFFFNKIKHQIPISTSRYTDLISAPNDIRYIRHDFTNTEYPSISFTRTWRWNLQEQT